MNFENLEVKHKAFGAGVIIASDGKYITVKFDSVTKTFVYPDIFERFLTLADGSVKSSFAFDARPSTVRTFGQLRFLDTNHGSIRSMERPARAVYATFDLPDSDVAGLAAGDCLLLPELESGVAGEWRCGLPDDGRFRVVSREEHSISFASFADGAMPPLPSPAALELYRGQAAVARGRFGSLCSKPAFVTEEVL